MPKHCPDNWNRPFSDLKRRLKKARRSLAAERSAAPSGRPQAALHRGAPHRCATDVDASVLFDQAMADVVPIDRTQCLDPFPSPAPSTADDIVGDDDTDLKRLRALVDSGDGFRICDTPEYIAGTGWWVHPEMAHRLHAGVYAVQAHIDLHGLTLEQSRVEMDRFIRNAMVRGIRCILVIHGRGLRSPGRPVLKTWIQDYLTTGPWRRWVLAYASARRCDGGAGATYVLLRQRPAPKKSRKCKK